MTCHAADGSLRASVVGFDYQRTMVAAAAAMLTTTAVGRIATGDRDDAPYAHDDASGAHDDALAACGSGRALLVGLGAGR